MLAPDQRKVLGSNPSAPKFVSMWDGVTGNASGFELEDEGSTPSPTASLDLSRTSAFELIELVHQLLIQRSSSASIQEIGRAHRQYQLCP